MDDREENGPDVAWREFMAGSAGADPPAPERVRESLARRGLPGGRPSAWQADALPQRRRASLRRAGSAAAIIVAFLLGTWTGRRPPDATAPLNDRYALFVVGKGDAEVREDVKVAEYGAWIRGLASSGTGVSGERLGDAAWTLAPDGAVTPELTGTAAIDRVTGFFIIAAPSADSALSIARGMPHLRHGGRLILRPIEPT